MYHHTFFPFFSGALGWLIFVVLLVPYFLPSIVAFSRGKDNAAAVFILNFFLGWTLIGWVVCLVWALSANKSTTVIVNHTGPTYQPAQASAYQPAPTPAYQQPSQPQPASHQTNPTLRPTTAKSASPQEKIDQLRQLKQLLDDGVLTEAEFNSQKAAILG
jgi:Superinfection immunity protein/Short C-terminal domain